MVTNPIDDDYIRMMRRFHFSGFSHKITPRTIGIATSDETNTDEDAMKEIVRGRIARLGKVTRKKQEEADGGGLHHPKSELPTTIVVAGDLDWEGSNLNQGPHNPKSKRKEKTKNKKAFVKVKGEEGAGGGDLAGGHPTTRPIPPNSRLLIGIEGTGDAPSPAPSPHLPLFLA
ncbi:hypothetical protein CRG98_019723 [Punica granatum]|uniref:Uncharacterized protein n=1 Tax=Punica granatum TaxID=22663 RepID=A0A2I0JU98_PUNGR|nr:hypothetical protein CRG98_019723 [Punica granatum]